MYLLLEEAFFCVFNFDKINIVMFSLENQIYYRIIRLFIDFHLDILYIKFLPGMVSR